jgi:hypothetical protein
MLGKPAIDAIDGIIRPLHLPFVAYDLIDAIDGIIRPLHLPFVAYDLIDD